MSPDTVKCHLWLLGVSRAPGLAGSRLALARAQVCPHSRDILSFLPSFLSFKQQTVKGEGYAKQQIQS